MGQGKADKMLITAVLAVSEVIGDVGEILFVELTVKILLEFSLGLVATAIGHVVLPVVVGAMIPRSRA